MRFRGLFLSFLSFHTVLLAPLDLGFLDILWLQEKYLLALGSLDVVVQCHIVVEQIDL
jgi:hypothetical protein